MAFMCVHLLVRVLLLNSLRFKFSQASTLRARSDPDAYGFYDIMVEKNQQLLQPSCASSTDVNKLKIENYRLKTKIDALEIECGRETQQVAKLRNELSRLQNERSFILSQHAEVLQELKGRRKEFEQVTELARRVYNEAVTVLKRKGDGSYVSPSKQLAPIE